jgi:hypothetical protein
VATKHDVTIGVLAALGGAVVALLIAAFVLGRPSNSRPDGSGDTDTFITLRPESEGCRVTGKATEVIAKKDKKIKWEIWNYCDTDQYVSLGNFRDAPSQPGNIITCAAPQGSSIKPYPFREGESAFSQRVQRVRSASGADRPGKADLELKTKSRDELEGAHLLYFFDVCAAASSEAAQSRIQSDPRLMIDD